MVIDFLKMDVVQRVFVTGQSEVYAAFVRFDELWGSCQDPINFAEVIWDLDTRNAPVQSC